MVSLFIAQSLNEQARRENQQLVQEKLDLEVLQLTEHIKDKLKLYQYGLQGLKATIEMLGVENFDHRQMTAYSLSRDFEKEFFGARGLGYIRLVQPHVVDDFLATARADRPDKTFDIRQLNPHSNSLFVIQYILPEGRNREAIGLDIGSESLRRNAALKAIETNSVQLTAPITLVQADEKVKHGFLILSPIYQDVSKQTPIGWTYAPLLIEEILSALISLNDRLNLYISDIEANEETFFFSHLAPNSSATQFKSTFELPLYGRTWHIEVVANESFIFDNHLEFRSQVFYEALGLASIIVLVILLLQLIYSRRIQRISYANELAKIKEQTLEKVNFELEKQVDERTKEIQKINLLQQSILNSSSYAIIAADVKGIITLFNPAAEKLLGYNKDEVIGVQTPAIFHIESEIIEKAKELSEELKQDIQPGFDVFITKSKSGKPDVNNWTYVHKSGSKIPVRLSVTCLKNKEQEIFGYLGIVYDISQEIAHEKSLSQAKELAEKASQAKAEFLANMSHEIRTPMNGLIGTLQLLKNEALSENGLDMLSKALYSSELLLTIINDILDFSKLESGKLKIEKREFNLHKLAEHIRSECSVTARSKGLDFQVDDRATHQFWEGDTIRIRQILLNLTNNAIKFTENGTVKVTIEENDDGSGLIFTVRDTGIGMSQETLSRLFHRFEQADQSTTRKYGGTGLGLSITKSLIDLMDGDIEARSGLNKGSTFTVNIPAKKSFTGDNEVTEEEISVPDLNHAKILVVEDNKVNQYVAKGILQQVNADISFAENGLEAVEAVQTSDFDLILMDIQMPIMDGLEACKIIKENHRDIPIIALTANAFDEDKQHYLSNGFDGYLPKPIVQQLLFRELLRLVKVPNELDNPM